MARVQAGNEHVAAKLDHQWLACRAHRGRRYFLLLVGFRISDFSFAKAFTI